MTTKYDNNIGVNMSKLLTLEQMQNMSIDNIINMYRDGYTIDENANIPNIDNLNHKIVSADISIGTGSLLLIGAGLLLYMYIRR